MSDPRRSTNHRVAHAVSNLDITVSLQNSRVSLEANNTEMSLIQSDQANHGNNVIDGSPVQLINESGVPRSRESPAQAESRWNTGLEIETLIPWQSDTALETPNIVPEMDIGSHASEARLALQREDLAVLVGEGTRKTAKRSASNNSAPGRLEPHTFSLKRQRPIQEKTGEPTGGWLEETRADKTKRVRIEGERDEGDAADTSNFPPPSPLRRRPGACHYCRRRKIKCSLLRGDSSCQSCLKAGVICTPSAPSVQPRSLTRISSSRTEHNWRSNDMSSSGVSQYSGSVSPVEPPFELSMVSKWRDRITSSNSEVGLTGERSKSSSPVGTPLWDTEHDESPGTGPSNRRGTSAEGLAMGYPEVAHEDSGSETDNESRQLVPAFEITSETPLNAVIDYFKHNSGLRDFTSQLEHADCSRYPIATGGLADIYRANLGDGTAVAIKRMRSNFVSEGKATKRTARELHAWSRLRNKNILDILGLAVFGDKLAMVSPWMNNGNVMQYMESHVDVDKYSLLAQVVEAVVYLHEMDVVHGDLKGDTILVSDDGTLKLTDFGLTMIHEQSIRFSTTDAGGGTYRWMAPELMQGESSRNKETDVYALGMTMIVFF